MEEKNNPTRTETFDLVKIITIQRQEVERLRNLTDAEFEEYLKEAEQKLIDPRDEHSIAKGAALRHILQEKMQKEEPSIPSELPKMIQSLD